jgi:hypothetical protein
MKKPVTTAATTAERLEEARAAHAETGHRLMEVSRARKAALDADDGLAEAGRLDSELATLRNRSRVQADRIALLKDRVSIEQREQRDREQEVKIQAVEALFSTREAIAADISESIVHLNKQFLQIQAVNREIDASWQWDGAVRQGLLIPREQVVAHVQYELFRVSCVPRLLGGQTASADAGVFPGSKSPRLELSQMPKKVKPLVEVMRETSDFASDVMRGRRSASTPAAPALQNGSAAPEAFTPTELSALLERQHELASLASMSPEQDSEYADNVVAIAKLSSVEQTNV